MRFLGFAIYLFFAAALFIGALVLQSDPRIFISPDGYRINYVNAIVAAGMCLGGCVALVCSALMLKRDR